MDGPVRVLHVLGTTQLGGAESRTMDLYRHMDRGRVQFDFLVHTQQDGFFDQEIQKLGGRIYRVPRFRFYNFFAYRKAMRSFFAGHHEFAAVEGHITSSAAVYLPIAKRAGVRVTIAHARSAGVDAGLKGALTRLMRLRLSQRTDYMFTCSRLAGISVFGKKAVEEGRTVFIPNAIDCQAFAYDEGVRERIRAELGIGDRYVIGHVGRFHYAKNHEYLLRIFAALCDGQRERSGNGPQYLLLLLGEGPQMDAMKQLAEKLGIAEWVFFLGNRKNVSDYYQAMDYFVYPSRYEGLPGAMIEAQASGLKCLMSDAVCDEAAVTELVRCMSIEADPRVWAEKIEETARYDRSSHADEVGRAGFDVRSQAERMMAFYESGVWR